MRAWGGDAKEDNFRPLEKGVGRGRGIAGKMRCPFGGQAVYGMRFSRLDPGEWFLLLFVATGADGQRWGGRADNRRIFKEGLFGFMTR
jgi:hypothetical protein